MRISERERGSSNSNYICIYPRAVTNNDPWSVRASGPPTSPLVPIGEGESN